jgi:hypothetical protein
MNMKGITVSLALLCLGLFGASSNAVAECPFGYARPASWYVPQGWGREEVHRGYFVDRFGTPHYFWPDKRIEYGRRAHEDWRQKEHARYFRENPPKDHARAHASWHR